uniref:Integrase catalytic domain-containing protein n=1 Tax=Amphimedon queenslandica TaxID=400682 RepID=A0A1X7VBN3_AMPQE
MRQDIKHWTPAHLALRNVRFISIHIHIVLSLLFSNIYLFTNWPESMSIVDITAATVAEALVSSWVSQFEVPSTTSTDRTLMKLLGTTDICTNSHHPQANGIIERFHGYLKGTLHTLPLSLVA